MKNFMIIAATLFVFLFGSASFAARPAIIGGIRDGAALGIMLESGMSDNAKLRFGFEANTSSNPGIVFVGGKWFLRDMENRFPMFLSGGLVGYLGNHAEAGPYISLIFERFLDVTPLFFEFGIDVVKSGRLQCQVGYYF